MAIASLSDTVVGPSTSTPPRRSFSAIKSSLLAQTSLPYSARHADSATSLYGGYNTLQLKPHKSLSEIVTEYFRWVG